MATYIDPVEASVREVLHDISYFEGYELPASPPETPPMKHDARMGLGLSLRERTPMHASLEKVFPRTPPQSPRKGLKRKFSNQRKSAFMNGLPLTPPGTPPTRVGIHTKSARTLSDSGNKAHQITIFTLKSRPTIVTIDVTDQERPSSLRESSIYSADSNGSASKDPLDRVRVYSARSTDSRYPSSPLAPPAYSPPPNTPANAYAPATQNYSMELQFRGLAQQGTGLQDQDPFNPFAYTGPKQYPNHSQRAPTQTSNGLWQAKGNYTAQFPNLPSPSTFQTSNASLVNLEKARHNNVPDHPKKKRHCKRKAVICCAIAATLLMVGIVAAVIIIVRLRHRHNHHKRGGCMDMPGMFVNEKWQEGYRKCT